MILTARTTRGREKTAVNALKSKVKNKDLDIKAVFHPEDLKGYIFIEGSESDIRDLSSEVRAINGIIDEEVGVDEIEKYLSDEQEEIKIEEGDEVEVIGGAFKGEEAKITRVDETNREVTIELLDAAVPIPTTVDADMVRKKANQG
ncbi:transcription elongation factor Spt5 [Candidatus Nanosalina sp. VS9-1]|uniref:transcription elongation factor Spt5 n=1 Tax=Candidatus Nanosalina sp. VS9-1 TaxID=3388566 RepID=UPI0039E034CD